MDKIEIQFNNKTKMSFTVLVFVCFLYVVAGILGILGIFFTDIDAWLCVLSIFISVIVGYIFMKRLFGPSPLTIDDDGIIENTNFFYFVSIGRIRWKDIIKVETKIDKQNDISTKHMLIYVSNPDFYIGRTDGFKRRRMEAHLKVYGTPIFLRIDNLKYDSDDLEALINSRLSHK